MTVINDFFADLFGHIRNVVVILLTNTNKQIQGIVLTQVPVELRSRAQADEDSQNWNYQLALCLVAGRVAHLLQVGEDSTLLCIRILVVELVLVFGVDVFEVIVDGHLSKSYQTGDALAVQNGTMKLDEFCAVVNYLDDLLDLLQATAVAVFDVWNEELEQILTHFVVDNCLAGNLLLLD